MTTAVACASDRKTFCASGSKSKFEPIEVARPRAPGMYRTFFSCSANAAKTVDAVTVRDSPTLDETSTVRAGVGKPPAAPSVDFPDDIPDKANFVQLQRQQEERHSNQNPDKSGMTPSTHQKKDSSSSRPFCAKSTATSSEAANRKKQLTIPLIYRMYESQSVDIQGIVSDSDDDEFHPEEASKALRIALSGGIQSDDRTVISVLLAHNNVQRQKIAAAYEDMYNRKLHEDVKEEAGGFFLDAVLALIQPAHLYLARLLYYAISDRSYGRNIAVEIALTLTASQLKVIRNSYHAEYRITLERDLNLKVEGLFGRMLQQILLARGRQLDNADIDMEVVERDVEELLAMVELTGVGLNELGRNFKLFNRIFGAQSLNHVRTVLEQFDLRLMWNSTTGATSGDGGHGSTNASVTSGSETRGGRDFETLIRKSVNIHSDIRRMLLLFARISRNMQLYFAEVLHEAISGTRPDHNSIIRILVSRSEIDLFDICDEYKRKYGHHVVYDLQSTCSGEFLRLLSQLVHPASCRSSQWPR